MTATAEYQAKVIDSKTGGSSSGTKQITFAWVGMSCLKTLLYDHILDVKHMKGFIH